MNLLSSEDINESIFFYWSLKWIERNYYYSLSIPKDIMNYILMIIIDLYIPMKDLVYSNNTDRIIFYSKKQSVDYIREISKKDISKPIDISIIEKNYNKTIYKVKANKESMILYNCKFWTELQWNTITHERPKHGHKLILKSYPFKYMKDLSIKDFKMIASGTWHRMILTKDDLLYLQGSSKYGQLGKKKNNLYYVMNAKNISMIECGLSHSMYLTKNNELYVTGNNSYGQLGLGISIYLEDFCELCYEFVVSPIPKEEKIIRIYAFGNNSFFINNKGDLFGCGSNKRRYLQVENTCGYGCNEIESFKKLNFKDVNSINLTFDQLAVLTSNGVFICSDHIIKRIRTTDPILSFNHTNHELYYTYFNNKTHQIDVQRLIEQSLSYADATKLKKYNIDLYNDTIYGDRHGY